MECILHIAFRLGFQKWSARSDDDKASMQKSKERIQKEFRMKKGLLIDYPQQGSGNSNNGPTAKRFFRDPQLTAEITGVDENLIRRFSVILQTLACGVQVDKFEEYATETRQLYLKLYKWFYLPASVRKILFHSANIIRHFEMIPIGILTEEAQECRNKDFKRFREYNTRKCSRVATNTDLMNKLLITSDPYISSLRQKITKTELPIDVEAKKTINYTRKINIFIQHMLLQRFF